MKKSKRAKKSNTWKFKKNRDQFFKKTGMTETDNQVEKLIGRINELVVVEKSTNQKTKKQVDDLGDFLKETKSPLLQIYKNSRNRSLTKAVMDKNQKLFQKKFYGYEDTKAIRMKKEIELAEKEIKQRKIGLEKQGKNAEKDIDLQNDMLALERRKERLARRQSPGIIARTIGAGKNQIRILKELGLLRGTFRVLFSPFKALGKIGLKAFGGFGGLALAVALPALFLFLNSSFWQKTKEFLVNKLIPFVGDLYNDYILPFGKLIGGLLIDAWNLILKYAPKLVDFVKDLYNDYILPFGGIIADFLPKAWNFVIDALMGERRAVGPGGQFSERSGGIVGKVFGFGKAIFDLGAMAFNALMSAGTYLKEAFLGKFVTIGPRGFRSRTRQGGLVGFIGNIIDFFYNLPTTMRDTFDNAYEFVTSSIATGLGKIADFLHIFLHHLVQWQMFMMQQ